MESNIIKIQRFYRQYKLNNLFKKYFKFITKDTKLYEFKEFCILLKKKELIDIVNDIILKMSKLTGIDINVNAKVLLVSNLISNYPNDLLGGVKDRHPVDILIYDWSKKLVEIFKSNENIYKYKLLSNYINNFNLIFNDWKKHDKNRTIQNIIVSFHNRKTHINKLEEEELNMEQKIKIINSLNNECNELIKSIQLIDPLFDVEYLKINHKQIYENFTQSIIKIYSSISSNYKKAYNDIIIEEFKEGNSEIVIKLINDTNDRILNLCNDNIKLRIEEKINDYTCKSKLDKIFIDHEYSELINYFKFMIDTVIVFSSAEDDEDNLAWNRECINRLNSLLDDNYYETIPSLLIEINSKIDIIINKINYLI